MVVKFLYTNLTTFYTNLIIGFKIISNRCQNYGNLVFKLYVDFVYQICIHIFEIDHTILIMQHTNLTSLYTICVHHDINLQLNLKFMSNAITKLYSLEIKIMVKLTKKFVAFVPPPVACHWETPPDMRSVVILGAFPRLRIGGGKK